MSQLALNCEFDCKGVTLMAEYKLYAKASPDGRSLGDCPFTQRANLALKLKKVNTSLVLINLSDKPEWFKKLTPAGSVPVLEFGNETITDSMEAVRYLDKTHPTPPLDLPGNKEAEEATSQVFSIFSSWAKNKDTAKDQELKEAFLAELKKIDKFMSGCKGPLLCGEEWSIADCVLAPRLYHIRAVAGHYLKFTQFSDYPNLQRYMDAVFATDMFKSTDYPEQYILQGWAKYFQ